MPRKPKGPPDPVNERVTLAAVLSGLERASRLSATRRRDLRSAVKRVATLLADEPAAVLLDLPVISARLAAVNPIAAGMGAKRFANVRSDFIAALKASRVRPLQSTRMSPLSPVWIELFGRLPERRARIGLSSLARYASARGLKPQDITDEVIASFIAAVRDGSLCRDPNRLQRQVTRIWNEATRDQSLGLRPVMAPSYRSPKRIAWALLSDDFRRDVEAHMSWCTVSDPFAADARPRPLAPRSLQLRRDHIHAAVTALVESGKTPAEILALADLVSPNNFKCILRWRLESVSGAENTFNRALGYALTQIAFEWVRVDPKVFAELKRLLGKMPTPLTGLTDKNKSSLRQFDDPAILRRLYALPQRLWLEVKRDSKCDRRTLAKAQAALAIAILCYMPLRLQNLTTLEFDTHLFLREGARATSTLEVPAHEVKNNRELAFEIPPDVAKMLIEYRDRIAPRILGHRPKRLFVNADGTAKNAASIAILIMNYLRRRAGIVLTPHQFRHLSAKIVLDLNPGEYETVRQFLGHGSIKTTVGAYAGIDSRRAARRHQHLVKQALANEMSARASNKRHREQPRQRRGKTQ